MNIVVCGSMVFSPEMLILREKLRDLGHDVVLPEFTEEYAKRDSSDHRHSEAAHNKIQHDLIKKYFDKIREGDAILVYNQTKKDVKHYVGGNTFLEMGFAHVLGKPIFMYFPIPDMGYRDEMDAMNPRVLNGDLTSII